jgi:hypothetical protein
MDKLKQKNSPVNRKREKFTWVGGIVVLGVEENEGKT